MVQVRYPEIKMSGTIAQNPNRQSGAIGSIPSATKSASNPTITTNPSAGVGAEWINTTSGDVFLCTDATTNANWWINQRGDSVKAPGERGLIAGGYNSTYSPTRTDRIDYITINTLSGGTDFGDLSIGSGGASGTSNGVNGRGIFYIEYDENDADSNVIDYFTIDTLGDATDFGNVTVARNKAGAVSNGTSERGLLGGGYIGGNSDVIDYVTISTPGNATDFGNLLAATSYTKGCFSNGTNDRGVWSGGETNALDRSQVTNYVTISTTGNASSFGSLTTEQKSTAGCSNDTNERGLVLGGSMPSVGYVNTISYFTINSASNSTDFGDLTQARGYEAGLSNGTNERGIAAGGTDGTFRDTIDYVTISSTGNATDFGDMTFSVQDPAGLSNGAL